MYMYMCMYVYYVHVSVPTLRMRSRSSRRGWRAMPTRSCAADTSYTRLVSNSAPTWSSRCCFTARDF